ncbi:hypothetical protein [Phenylobacterium conjunctum]|uniref:Secreted protein n=1 Tax=Phenylobacterium conjunctum TaxID=1298959 RepID=A0ABW3T6U3_9CAUL
MTRKLVAPAAALLALLGASSAGLGLHELARASQPGQPPLIVRFDTSEDEQAKAAVRAATAASHDFSKAKALVRSALAQSAYNTDARLRLVYIDTVEHGAPTPEGLQQLRQSYDLAPYDPTSASWRTKFVFEFWDTMPTEIRKSAVAEAGAFYKAGSRRANMAPTLSSIANPNGAKAAAALVNGRKFDIDAASPSRPSSTVVVE